jgi:transposase
MAGRRKFSREFKMEAVRMVGSGEQDLVRVAEDLGIRADMLRKWKGRFSEDQEGAFPGSGRLKPADEEVRSLRRQLRWACEERDILKKAMAIFSDPRR